MRSSTTGQITQFFQQIKVLYVWLLIRNYLLLKCTSEAIGKFEYKLGGADIVKEFLKFFIRYDKALLCLKNMFLSILDPYQTILGGVIIPGICCRIF